MSEIPIQINLTPGLIAIGILLLLNGVLAMAEAALLSSRKARLQNESNKGNERATAALKLTDNPNQFLSVIQIGITTIDLLIGALTGATLGLWIHLKLAQYAALVSPCETRKASQRLLQHRCSFSRGYSIPLSGS
jgi:putative hemolysin